MFLVFINDSLLDYTAFHMVEELKPYYSFGFSPLLFFSDLWAEMIFKIFNSRKHTPHPSASKRLPHSAGQMTSFRPSDAKEGLTEKGLGSGYLLGMF